METTFLTEDQIWGDKQLDVLNKYENATALTDLAVVLGGYLGSSTTNSEGERSGFVWSASADEDGNVRAVSSSGCESW